MPDFSKRLGDGYRTDGELERLTTKSPTAYQKWCVESSSQRANRTRFWLHRLQGIEGTRLHLKTVVSIINSCWRSGRQGCLDQPACDAPTGPCTYLPTMRVAGRPCSNMATIMVIPLEILSCVACFLLIHSQRMVDTRAHNSWFTALIWPCQTDPQCTTSPRQIQHVRLFKASTPRLRLIRMTACTSGKSPHVRRP